MSVKGKCDPVDLCATDPDLDRCGTEDRKETLSKYWSIYTGLGDSFLENLQGLTTLKIYQADQQKADEMDVESQNFRRITMKVLTMQLNSTSVMDIVAYGGAAIGMAVAVSEFLKRKYQCGRNVMYRPACQRDFSCRFVCSVPFFHIAMNGMAASDKIFKILDLPEPQAGAKMSAGWRIGCVVEGCSLFLMKRTERF